MKKVLLSLITRLKKQRRVFLRLQKKVLCVFMHMSIDKSDRLSTVCRLYCWIIDDTLRRRISSRWIHMWSLSSSINWMLKTIFDEFLCQEMWRFFTHKQVHILQVQIIYDKFIECWIIYSMMSCFKISC